MDFIIAAVLPSHNAFSSSSISFAAFGDFVRLKIYKPKPRRPKYTYKDGPLRL
eukprot:COSAG05_NODE_8662_length_682_cov_2.125214_2_plen_52_part_01